MNHLIFGKVPKPPPSQPWCYRIEFIFRSVLFSEYRIMLTTESCEATTGHTSNLIELLNRTHLIDARAA